MYQIFNTGLHSLPGAPIGIPAGAPTQNLLLKTNPNPKLKPEIPGDGLPRALTYLADYGGCGFYRCISPNLLLNLYQKSIMIDSTTMVFDPKFYSTVQAVKFQRQATPAQSMFIKQLKEIFKQTKSNTKMLYEIDDVVFAEDIPLYNRNREAFTSKEIQNGVRSILENMDEIIVSSSYFKDYLINKTGHKNVTVIENYLMKWWFDRYYNLGDLIKKYEKNKKKPKISIFGSGTHVDVLRRCRQQDDFEFIVDAIIKTRSEYEWHFYGCYPLQLKPLIDEGKIKFTNWVQLPDYANLIHSSGTQLTFAALRDNEFNRCKSNIKLTESGALGIPCVCPDLVTYKDAALKYTTGDEFIDCIKHALKNQTVYADFCKKSRAYAEQYWLDDEKNLMKHYEAYFTPYNSSNRKYLK